MAVTEGGVRVDMHVKVLDDRVVELAKAKDMDAVVYAPHFTRLPTIRRTARRFTDEDLLVVPAREVFTGSWRHRKHVLAMGLDEPVPDFTPLASAMGEFERQDAAVLVPHPEFMTVSLTATDVRSYANQIDAIEVYNPKYLPWHTPRARAIARGTELPTFGSSYAHLRGSVGEAWTEFEAPIGGPSDLVDAVRRGAITRVCHRPGLAHRFRCTAEFAHLFYENSVAKAAGLARGAKPTNPHHPAYGGRFEEVAVYDRPRVRPFAG